MAPQDILAPLLTKADFHDFLIGEPEERYEFENGRIVHMPGGTANHAGIGGRFFFEIAKQIDEDRWMVFGPDRGIETPDSVRYPDTVVEILPVDPHSRWTTKPALVVEVLSPDSQKRDKVTKAVEYTAFQMLEAYIVAEPDKPECLVWTRDAFGHFASEPDVVAGEAGVIAVPALGLSLPLAAVYRHILRGTPK
jgi:Uma2 family endonuclease